MSIDRTERMITGDLAALSADSRRGLRPFAEMMPSVSAGVYRDDRASAEAARNARADECRRELALMPMALAHTFAHRVGRAAAGGAAIAGSVVLAAVLSEAWLTRLAAEIVPGLGLPLIVALLGGAVVLAYALGTAIAEVVFARRMERAIATSADPHADLETLAAGPIAAGHELVRKVDRWSIALALGGLIAVVPLVSYLAFAFAVIRSPAAEMLSVHALERVPVGYGVDVMMAVIAGGLALAALVAQACDRERTRAGLPAWVERLGHWIMVPLGFVLGLVVLIASLRMARAFQLHGTQAATSALVLLTMGSVASIFMPAAWALLWWRRREHARLGL